MSVCPNCEQNIERRKKGGYCPNCNAKLDLIHEKVHNGLMTSHYILLEKPFEAELKVEPPPKPPVMGKPIIKDDVVIFNYLPHRIVCPNCGKLQFKTIVTLRGSLERKCDRCKKITTYKFNIKV